MEGSEEKERLCRLALGMTNGVNADAVERMMAVGMTAEEFFALTEQELSMRLNMRHGRTFAAEDRRAALEKARDQIMHIDRHNVKTFSLIAPESYPHRLRECADAPVNLLQLGDANLNARNVVAIVGTRRPTPYGISFTQQLVKDLKSIAPDLLIVSGLAYGIDSAAHAAAVAEGVPTVGVVAHGLQMLYPAAHRDLAKRMLQNGGGIVTEYPFGAKPWRQSFLERNRVIAGLADITFIVESAIKSGARSTAASAASYGRDVFALPGRITDEMSTGCNKLIADGNAMMFTSINDLVDSLHLEGIHLEAIQKSIFEEEGPKLDEKQQSIVDLLKRLDKPTPTDSIANQLRIPVRDLMPILTELELDGHVLRHPGNRFSVSDF